MTRKSGLPDLLSQSCRYNSPSLVDAESRDIPQDSAGEIRAYSSIGMNLKTYSHAASGLQEAAAERFEEIV